MVRRRPAATISGVGPCVDGSGLSSTHSNIRSGGRGGPCVRPLSAARMAAGHNALRGSGPGQEHAFNHAVAQMGCPDHRIDRSALSAVRPPTVSCHRCRHDPLLPARQATWPAPSVLDRPRAWPSLPGPYGRSYWPARWLPLSPADDRAAYGLCCATRVLTNWLTASAPVVNRLRR